MVQQMVVIAQSQISILTAIGGGAGGTYDGGGSGNGGSGGGGGYAQNGGSELQGQGNDGGITL